MYKSQRKNGSIYLPSILKKIVSIGFKKASIMKYLMQKHNKTTKKKLYN